MISREEFAAAFSLLTGVPRPVPWQAALHRLLHEGVIPDALDLPTGLGKTSVMAIWLLARAGGAKVPRRLFVVVNNRAVVDQATAVAERLADALDPDRSEWAGRDDEARRLLGSIRAGLGLSDGERLPVSTLRGQRADNRAWLLRPGTPAVIVGTVDMIGSRLLFSGYAVSRWSRSMHAGLVGIDSLVVLDESHLVPPFAQLLDAAGSVARQGFAPASALFPDSISPFRSMCLSATGRGRVGRVLGLGDADLEDDWVRRRMHASKSLRVIESNEKTLVETMASRAVDLAAGRGAVVVFCGGFDRTHAIADAIERLVANAVGATERRVVVRLTGQIRVRERSALERDPVFRRFVPGETPGDDDVPAFLVANSAGEVGIDVDADHMVADVVPWERTVQRLGRVNRAGLRKAATVDVFAARPTNKDAAARFDRWLAPLVHDAWPVDADGCREASPAALRELKKDEAFRAVSRAAESEELYRPPLSGALIDAWSMTSLTDHSARPLVSPWLRGWEDDEPDVTILWRRHLPGTEHVGAYLEDAPPHLLETLTVPLRTAHPWLLKVTGRERRGRQDASRSDAGVTGEFPAPLAAIVVRHDDFETFDATTLARRVAAPQGSVERLPGPGDVIILDAGYGGLAPHGVLDARQVDPPLCWDVLDAPERAADDEPGPAANNSAEPSERSEVPSSKEPEPFGAVPRRWREGAMTPRRAADGYRAGRYREPVRQSADRSEEDGDVRMRWVDVAVHGGGSADTRGERSLDDHHRDVADVIRACCEELALDGSLRDALVQAALHHDLGKARALWQRAAGAPTEDPPLAKIGQPMNGRLLGGYRHEFGSVSDASDSPTVRALDESTRDVALHLVAAHHGRGRPWIPPHDPDSVPPLLGDETNADAALAGDIAMRFDRVQARVGHWTLAWLEALLRASDWEASRVVDESAGEEERVR